MSDEPLYEMINGQRVDLPPMSILSNMIACRLSYKIMNHLMRKRQGTMVMKALLILDDETDTRRRPDVAFVSAERWPLDREIPETGDWAVVPDLAVEVASPNDVLADVVGKLGEYFAHGVREAWLVIPEEQQVYVYTSSTDVRILSRDQSLESPLLPGLSIPLKDVFARTVATSA
jgi:Uma2 family endonuclease